MKEKVKLMMNVSLKILFDIENSRSKNCNFLIQKLKICINII